MLRDENLDYTVLETINKWLEAIGMQRYTETFLHNGYSTPRQILSLNLEDLEKLEIGPIGHKMKIFKAIQNTKLQVNKFKDRDEFYEPEGIAASIELLPLLTW